MGTSGLRGAPERCGTPRAPCVHGTPVFQSRDKDEARKGGLHGTRCAGGQEDERGREKKRETVRAKEVRKPKVEGYRRDGEYKARYASQAAVIVGGAGRSEGEPPYHPSLRPSSSHLSLSPSENDLSLALGEDEKGRGGREETG